MKPSYLLALGGLVWGLSSPALPAYSADSAPADGLASALLHITKRVGEGRVDEAWEEFSAVRERVMDAPVGTSRLPDPGEDLEPALLGLGRAFLLWENPEAALDVWQAAAERGSRAAAARMTEAVRKKGWPYWLNADAMPTLGWKIDRLPRQPFREAVVAEEPGQSPPSMEDPLYRHRYRYSMAVYLPSLSGQLVTGRRRGGEGRTAEESGDGKPVPPGSGYLYQRFQIHYQRPGDAALAQRLARNFAALYALTYEKLGRQTPFEENGLVHVWLASEGEAGGEQWKEHLYFYDLERPRSHLEWMRETAHEYGHACLPGTSGFTEPEGWANGELGERLALRWLVSAQTAEDRGEERGARGEGSRAGGRVGGASDSGVLDALNLKASGIDAYLARFVQPLVTQTAEKGWQPAVLAKRDARAMDQVLGLALWAEAAHGTSFLKEMLDRVPDEGPPGPWEGYTRAVAARLKAGGNRPLLVAPVAGRLRFTLPNGGRYRLTWTGGGTVPLTLSMDRTIGGQPAKGKPVRVTPGQAWAASPGSYVVDRPAGVLKIERG